MAVAALPESAGDDPSIIYFSASMSVFLDSREGLETKDKAGGDVGPYDGLFVPRKPGQTIVQLPGSPLEFVVELPAEGERTVWAVLGSDDRVKLVRSLAEEAASTNFYHEAIRAQIEARRRSREKKEREEEPAPKDDAFEAVVRQLVRDGMAKLTHERHRHRVLSDAMKEYRGKWVLSPRLFFVAKRGAEIVCSESNQAVAAASLELGVPFQEIRLVSGFNDQREGHMWGEVLHSLESWWSFDGTSRRVMSDLDVPRTREQRLDDVLRPMIRRSRGSLRERYPVSLTETHFQRAGDDPGL